MYSLAFPFRGWRSSIAERMDMSSCDLLIVGGGAAGLRAAIAAAAAVPELDIAVVSKVYPMRSHTVSAEGGAAAVIKPGDSLDAHSYDTISGADWLCDQDVVEAFVEEAPREMLQLEHWGCPWNREPDGSVAVRLTELTVPLLGRMNLSNALAATSLGLHFGVAREEIAAAVASCRPASHRGVIVRLRDDITVVDDSYNSNPTALREMLDSLQRLGGARRVAVLGEMLELGDRAMELHAAMGRAVVAAGVELLVTVGGPPADALAQEAVATGLPAASVSSVETSEEAADVVSTLVRSGDLVLVKGSRGIRTDVVVGRLQERFR